MCKILSRVPLALLLALFLSLAPRAAETALEERMAQFRSDYGLNEQNFSLCYYDTVSGETYRYNDRAFWPAASTYKLPLNLYYYELEQSGALGPTLSIGGMPLSKAHYQSLVWSDNEISISMLYGLGNFRTYKEKMRKYFTMDASEIPYQYYVNNVYCTAMMLDALQYVYERQAQFPELLDHMKEAQPGQYFKRLAGETEIAHKYGFFYDEDERSLAVNDVGIVYAPHPFLLAAYTRNAADGEEVLAQLCATLLEYQDELSTEAAPGPAPEAPPEPTPVPVPEAPPELVPATPPASGSLLQPALAQVAPTAPAEDPSDTSETVQAPVGASPGTETPEETVHRNLWWMILIALTIFLLADIGVFFWMRRGGMAKLESRWGDEEEDEEENI